MVVGGGEGGGGVENVVMIIMMKKIAWAADAGRLGEGAVARRCCCIPDITFRLYTAKKGGSFSPSEDSAALVVDRQQTHFFNGRIASSLCLMFWLLFFPDTSKNFYA